MATRQQKRVAAIAAQLERGRVYTIRFACSYVPGDNGTVDAFWTGERDTRGKRTFQPINGSSPLYLFDREIIDVELV